GANGPPRQGAFSDSPVIRSDTAAATAWYVPIGSNPSLRSQFRIAIQWTPRYRPAISLTFKLLCTRSIQGLLNNPSHATDSSGGEAQAEKPALGRPPMPRHCRTHLLGVVGHRARSVSADVYPVAIGRVPYERTGTNSLESIVAIVVSRVAGCRCVVYGNAAHCVIHGHIPACNASGPDENAEDVIRCNTATDDESY